MVVGTYIVRAIHELEMERQRLLWLSEPGRVAAELAGVENALVILRRELASLKPPRTAEKH